MTVRVQDGLNYRAKIATEVCQRLDNDGQRGRVTDKGHKIKRRHRINSKRYDAVLFPQDETKQNKTEI